MSSTRLGYRELGIKLVYLEYNLSFHPKCPHMEEEKRNEGEEYPIKLFITESLAQQRNEMLENFPKSFHNFLE